ncbi:MAG: DnaA N-terminal domain-containing protein [Patescibacteria group bacterium]
MDLDQIWKAALGELEVRLSPANFGMWFKDTLILDFKNSVATIATPNAFNREWIRDKYDKEIFLTLKKTLARCNLGAIRCGKQKRCFAACGRYSRS